MNKFNKIITEIREKASLVEVKWTRLNNDYNIFPEVVLEEFKNFDFSYFAELSNLSQILNDPSIRSLQSPSSFSDLYYKIFDNGKFWIEILNWWGLDINIHDHDFSGVQFQLLGESFNTVYNYEDEETYHDIAFGSYNIKRVELWKAGDYSIVRPGRVEPHNVVHLSTPTVSLLIRTHPHQNYGPQNNYFPPLIRANYGLADGFFRKKVALLRLLATGNKENFHKTFKEIVSNQNASENLFTIIKMADILFTHDNSELLLDTLNSIDTVTEVMIQAGAYYKNVTFLSYIVKNLTELTLNEKYLIAIMACSFDRDSFETIFNSFINQYSDFDPDNAYDNITKYLPDRHLSRFRNCFKLLGIEPSIIRAKLNKT